jgi:uncharacterized protein YcfL
MKYVSIALLTSLALVGCSKPQQDDVENKELALKEKKRQDYKLSHWC